MPPEPESEIVEEPCIESPVEPEIVQEEEVLEPGESNVDATPVEHLSEQTINSAFTRMSHRISLYIKPNASLMGSEIDMEERNAKTVPRISVALEMIRRKLNNYTEVDRVSVSLEDQQSLETLV